MGTDEKLINGKIDICKKKTDSKSVKLKDANTENKNGSPEFNYE